MMIVSGRPNKPLVYFSGDQHSLKSILEPTQHAITEIIGSGIISTFCTTCQNSLEEILPKII